jgi:hypothetical protein
MSEQDQKKAHKQDQLQGGGTFQELTVYKTTTQTAEEE